MDNGTLEKDRERVKDQPHVWIQWKGTDACCDIHCKCGALLHFDGFFFYAFRCPHCKTLFEVGSHVPIYEVKEVSEWYTPVDPQPDDDYDETSGDSDK